MALLYTCVVVTVFVASMLAVSHSCPAGCTCPPKDDMVITVCASRNFTSVPEGIPSNTVDLYMTGNRMSVLVENSFPGLDKLQTLVLKNCGINKIEPGAFSGLKQLEELDLENNKLMALQGNTFTGLISLHTLRLSKNMLETIHDFVFSGLQLNILYLEHNSKLWSLHERAFEGASVKALYLYNNSLTSDSTTALTMLKNSLKELHWQHNKIPLSLPSTMFQGFTFSNLKLNGNSITDVSFLTHTKADDLSLEQNPTGPIDFRQYETLANVRTLRLSNTHFKYINVKYFENLKDLKTVYLSENGISTFDSSLESLFNKLDRLVIDKNNLHCNCELLWFKRWLTAAAKHIRGARCSSPSSLAVEKMSVANMTCTQPEISSFSRSANISKTGDVTLTCGAHSDPAPEIRWQGPAGLIQVVEPPANRSDRTNAVTVIIKATSEHHVGTYTCLAINLVGNATKTTSIDSYVIIPTAGCSREAGPFYAVFIIFLHFFVQYIY